MPRRVADLDPFTATWGNAVEDGLRAAIVVTDGSILVDHTPACQLLRLPSSAAGAVESVLCFGLVEHGTGGWYGGVELEPTAAGTWATRAGGLTIDASDHLLLEREGFAGLAVDGTVRVRAERDRGTGIWIFQRGLC